MSDIVHLQGSPVTAYKTALSDAERSFGESNFDECVRHCCRALEAMPGEEAPVHLINVCQGAMRASNGLEIQPLPVFLTNWKLFCKQKEKHIFPGSVCAAAGNFLYALTRLLTPGRVIETGTLFGFSCMCIGQALKDNGHGELHAFDLFLDKNYPDLEEDESGYSQVLNTVRDAGLGEWVSLHQGSSASLIRETFANQKGSVDMAFIDGDHLMLGCLADFQAVDEVLADDGIVVFYDTEPRDSGWMGPRFLIEKLRAQQNMAPYEFVNIPTLDKLGLALMKKSGTGKIDSWRPSLTELVAEQLLFHKHFRRRVRDRTG